MLSELKIGSIIIANDLLGFVVKFDEATITLNTELGERQINRSANIAVLTEPVELLASVIANLRKVIKK